MTKILSNPTDTPITTTVNGRHVHIPAQGTIELDYSQVKMGDDQYLLNTYQFLKDVTPVEEEKPVVKPVRARGKRVKSTARQ